MEYAQQMPMPRIETQGTPLPLTKLKQQPKLPKHMRFVPTRKPGRVKAFVAQTATAVKRRCCDVIHQPMNSAQATLRQSHARSIIKIVDLHFTFQSTRLFSNKTTEIPALAPCKMEVTLMIYVDCKSKYVRMVTAFQSQSKTERSCLKVDQCSWVQLHKPQEIQQPMPYFQGHPTSSPAKGTAAS